MCDLADDTHFYYLGITSDGYYAIIKREGDRATILTDASGKWVQSIHYPRNLPSYRVAADCGTDGTLAVYANGQLVGSAQDTTYQTGRVGLFVRTFDQAPAEVRFSDLIVTALH